MLYRLSSEHEIIPLWNGDGDVGPNGVLLDCIGSRFVYRVFDSLTVSGSNHIILAMQTHELMCVTHDLFEEVLRNPYGVQYNQASCIYPGKLECPRNSSEKFDVKFLVAQVLFNN